jgi:HEAT repeats/Putative zinc-finger
MICDRIREQIPECLAGRLDATAREKVIDHLDTCSACRAEVAELGVVWRGFESMSEAEPSPAVRTRFLETLSAYQEGYQEAQRRQAYAVPQKSWWAGLLPAKPVWQAVFAASLLLAGGLGGRFLAGERAAVANPDMAQLKTQVENLRQLVTLSLLQEQSPSARLRGVTYSYQVTQPDPQVEQELLHTVNHDSNVNVRLSAVDAIAKFAQNPEVRRALVDSIPMQNSPLVQVALIDLLLQLKDKDAVPALHKLAQDKQTDEMVRQHAESALQKLEASR